MFQTTQDSKKKKTKKQPTFPMFLSGQFVLNKEQMDMTLTLDLGHHVIFPVFKVV